jgi:hypothetical protein
VADPATPLNGLLDVEMSFVPAQAMAVASDEDGFEWRAPYQVTLREANGDIGGTVTGFNVTVYEAAGGQAGAEAAAADSRVQLPGNRIGAGGSLDATFETYYTLANGQKAAFVDVVAFIVDDAGLGGQVTKRLTVQ